MIRVLNSLTGFVSPRSGTPARGVRGKGLLKQSHRLVPARGTGATAWLQSLRRRRGLSGASHCLRASSDTRRLPALDGLRESNRTARNPSPPTPLPGVPGRGGEEKNRLTGVPGRGGEEKARLAALPGPGAEKKNRLTGLPGRGGEEKARLAALPGPGAEKKNRSRGLPERGRNSVSAALALVLSIVVGMFSTRGMAAEPEKKETGPVSYYKEVRPLFQQHCQGCHQPAKPLGGFVMTSFADLLKKADRELPGVVPGHPEKSFLLEQISTRTGKKAEMPKGKDPLPEKDVALVQRWIAEGAKDDTPATARDPVDADHPPIYNLPPVIPSVAFSPDGNLLAIAGFHEVLLHKGDGSGLVARLVGLSERVQAVAFSPDGKWLAAAGGSPGRFGEIQLWEVATHKLKLSIPVTFDTLYGVSWSHDSTKIAVGCADNTLRAFEAATGKQILYQGAHNDWVLGTTFSKDSRFIVSVSRDRTVKLTEVATQRFIDNVTSITPGALKGGLSAVALQPQPLSHYGVGLTGLVAGGGGPAALLAATAAPARLYDDALIFGGADGIPRLYKMHRTRKRVIGDDFNKVREYPALPGRIYALAVRPDGEWFAAGSSLDGSGEIRVFRTEDASQVSKLEGQPGPVYSLSWKPDGKVLASAGFDGVVRLSDPATGKVLKEFTPVPLAATARK
jgi:WD40 repeat protein/mono/diheme cytochrome c family protein